MSGRRDRRTTGKDLKGRGLERMKSKTTGVLPEGQGKSPFSLDFTYHGCPLAMLSQILYGKTLDVGKLSKLLIKDNIQYC